MLGFGFGFAIGFVLAMLYWYWQAGRRPLTTQAGHTMAAPSAAAAEDSAASQIADLSAELERIKASLAAAEEQGRVLETERDTQVAALQSLQAKLAEQTSADADRQALQSELTAVRAELATVKVDFDNAQNGLDSTRTELATIKANSDKVRGELEAIRTELEAAKADSDSSRNKLETARAELATIKTDSDGLHSELEIARTKLAECEQTVAALENQLQAPAEQTTPAEAETESEQEKLDLEALKASLPLAQGEPDDLKKVKGIGKVIEHTLNDFGITTFQQLAQFSDQQLHQVAQALKVFPERAERDDWIGQARRLHTKKYGEKP